MKLHIFSWMLYGGLIFMLMGCGGVAEREDVTGILELTPLPTGMANGDCTAPSELENWIQTLVFNQAEFTTSLQSASDLSRTQLFRLVQDLNAVAITVASAPVLSCGEESYQLTISAMQATLNDMRAYVNAERHDLDTIIANAQTRFVETQAQHDVLIALLEELYRNNTTP